MYQLSEFENKKRGTLEFPLEFHHVTESHPRYVMPYHWHREIELVRVAEGNLIVHVDNAGWGAEYHLKKDDFLFIHPNAVHGAEPKKGCVYQCIVLDLELLLQNNVFFSSYEALFSSGKQVSAYYGKQNEEAHGALKRLFNAAHSRREGWKLIATGCILQFLGEALEAGCLEEDNAATLQNAQNIAKFRNVFRLIQRRFAEPLALDDMAQAANMAPNYFCKAFKDATHYSPIEYLTRYRIEYSKQLLRTKGSSVKEAAFLSGFGSPAYYIKVFKKIVGMTPNQYKKDAAS